MVSGKQIPLQRLNFELKLCALERKLFNFELELRAFEPELLLPKLVELDVDADIGGGGGHDGARRLDRPEADVGSSHASAFSAAARTAASWVVLVKL